MNGTDGHTLWQPAESRPKPRHRDRRRKTPLNAAQLSVLLRETVDAAAIYLGDVRSNSAAIRRLRRILTDHPDALSRSHVTHNLGPRRIAWLSQMGLR